MTTYISPIPFRRFHWFFRFFTPHQKFVSVCKFWANYKYESMPLDTREILSDLVYKKSFESIYQCFYRSVIISIEEMPNNIPHFLNYLNERVECLPQSYKTLKPSNKQLKQYSELMGLLDELETLNSTKDIIHNIASEYRTFEDETRCVNGLLKKTLKLAYKLTWSIYRNMLELSYKILLHEYQTEENELKWYGGESLWYDCPTVYKNDQDAKQVLKDYKSANNNRLFPNRTYCLREIYAKH